MFRLLTACLLASATSICLAAEPPVASDLLPPGCIAYAELTQPQQLLDTAFKHPLWERIQTLEPYQQAIQDPKYLFFQGIVASIETRIGMTWREAYETVLGGGIYAAFDPATQGGAILIRSQDETKLHSVFDRLIELVRSDARSKNKDNPLPENEYRGLTIYGAPGGRFAIVGPWIVFSSKDELGRSIVDAWLDGRNASLSSNPQFQQARTRRSDGATLWSWVDIGMLRDSGVASNLKDGRAENPGLELIAGGILSTLKQTPYVTAALHVSPQTAAIELAVPHEPDWIDESREFWFGPNGTGAALPLHQTAVTVFSLSTYRDIAEMWLRAGDLFDAATNDKLAQAESTLSTLFAGRDFAEDILRSFAPQYRLVVAKQDFADRLPRPAIRLPAFALIAEMRDAETAQPELRRTYQSLVGFLNVVGAQNGNPQLDQDIESVGDAKVYTAQFVPEADEKESTRARIQFNFSPSAAFAGRNFILASTRQLARQLSTELSDERPADTPTQRTSTSSDAAAGDGPANTEFRLDVQVLSEILNDNREQLIAQNMISDGHSREEAEQQISLLLSALKSVRDVNFRLTTTGGQLRANLSINTPAP